MKQKYWKTTLLTLMLAIILSSDASTSVIPVLTPGESTEIDEAKEDDGICPMSDDDNYDTL